LPRGDAAARMARSGRQGREVKCRRFDNLRPGKVHLPLTTSCRAI